MNLLDEMGDVLGVAQSQPGIEGYVDDQTSFEDRRDDTFIGGAIVQACNVYDTLISALEYVVRGKANVIGKLDDVVKRLEDTCQKIAEKYDELLSKLNDKSGAFEASLSFDLANSAFDLLNNTPQLRRYLGEANYWVLWDTLATLKSQGASLGADMVAGIKEAVKAAIYASLAMTDGMLHFESYISQITTFWGMLYMKDIWLPLTDSICPQVTCAYYYKAAESYNPVPGPAAFAPLPLPVFDPAKYDKVGSFEYGNPDTWDVLTPDSKAAMERAHMYWKSSYTNANSLAQSLNYMLSVVSGGKYTLGLNRNPYKGGEEHPLRVGHTLAQLDTAKEESFPVILFEYDNRIASCTASLNEVDEAFVALLNKLQDADIIRAREDAKNSLEDEYADTFYEIQDAEWLWAAPGPAGITTADDAYAVKCMDIVKNTVEYSAFLTAASNLTAAFYIKNGIVHPGADKAMPQTGIYSEPNPLTNALLDEYKKIRDSFDPSDARYALYNAIVNYAAIPGVLAPYNLYVVIANDEWIINEDQFFQIVFSIANGDANAYTPFFKYATLETPDIASISIETGDEIGYKISGGRKAYFPVLGIYGDLIGMESWDYEIVPKDKFMESHVRINNDYHLYYSKDDPTDIVFADRTIRAGSLTCIAAHKPLYRANKKDGPTGEGYTWLVYPSESCAVYALTKQNVVAGFSIPSINSILSVDASTEDNDYHFDLTRNTIPRYAKYVDPKKWSIMDIIHELYLLVDFLSPICGDGGKRRDRLNRALNDFGLYGGRVGDNFIGQLPINNGDLVSNFSFELMNEFAGRIDDAISAVYKLRKQVWEATAAW